MSLAPSLIKGQGALLSLKGPLQPSGHLSPPPGPLAPPAGLAVVPPSDPRMIVPGTPENQRHLSSPEGASTRF